MTNDQRDPRVDPVAGDVVETRNGSRFVVLYLCDDRVWSAVVSGPDDGCEEVLSIADWRACSKTDTIIARGGAR